MKCYSCHKFIDVLPLNCILQVMIYDDAGYIAGVQSVLLESNVDMAYNNLTKQVGNEPLYTIHLSYSLCRKDSNSNAKCSQPAYAQDVWMGQTAWFTTAYFVDPLVICNGGRSSCLMRIRLEFTLSSDFCPLYTSVTS